MNGVLDDKSVLSRIEAYFNMLKRTGYVKGKITSRYLVYMFLYDFVDTLYDFMSEEDYNIISRKLSDIFSDGGCLLPYRSAICRGAHIGTPRYEGPIVKRVTEDALDNLTRVTEDDNQRAAV